MKWLVYLNSALIILLLIAAVVMLSGLTYIGDYLTHIAPIIKLPPPMPLP